MRISTRLTIALVATVLVIVGAYVAVSHAQRRALFSEALVLEAETLGQTLQLASEELLVDGRVATLDRLLHATLEREGVFAALVLDAAGATVAGGAADAACMRRSLADLPLQHGGAGWAGCGAGIYWTALPLRATGGTLVVALRQMLLDQAAAAALLRQVLLALTLLLAVALAIHAILRRALSEPLGRILHGVRHLAETGTAPDIRVGRGAGELAHLARAFNETAAQLEAKHRELQGSLDERIALERRLKESEKFAMLGRLSGGLAHELGSPLSVIGMRAEALAGAPGIPELARQYARSITTEVVQLTEFIEGLLHIARRHGIVFDPVDLTELLRSLQCDLAARIEGAHIALQVQLPEAPVVVLGQETMLRHALRNLLRNGYHALRLHTGERSIRVRIEPGAYEVRVVVEDTGPGIPPERLEQVFEPFFTTKEVGAGSGLGLPISRGIVEEHGGELWLENRLEGGVRAVLTLPLPPDPSDAPDVADSHSPATPGAADEP